MGLVTLVSGGLDSTLMAVLALQEGIGQFPLFIDYGQLCVDQEWAACQRTHSRLGLPQPVRMNLAGFGQLIPSGLTNRNLRINEDAFLPGRNLLFLLAGSAYAYKNQSSTVGIGLLSEESHIFPDQTSDFVKLTEKLVTLALGYHIRIVAPLMNLNKAEVLALAKEWGIEKTYSCHAGTVSPCGVCVSCQEIIKAQVG